VGFNGTQCQGTYAFEKFISQELSSRVGENTEFIFLQLEGKINKDVIKNIFSLFCLNALNA
jgi:hypothetical protein